ncbi:hypothetical protein FOWG_09442 [Fusarium oxysporum f. sp. lycopersici MN25]|nr:hypothetical protein FOWG_09442 [Fusarium oxysporum f. sp. lycopersici MN25]
MSRNLPELGEDCKGLAKNAAGNSVGFGCPRVGKHSA